MSIPSRGRGHCRTAGRRLRNVGRVRYFTLTATDKPADAAHWSSRKMAQVCGLSATTVRAIWRKAGLKPHRVRGFKLACAPQFQSKLEDVVGLYLNPPERTIVFSVDEKSQIQALDRTQPGLPLKRGRGDDDS